MSSKECPPEALVLLDEAFEALPKGIEPAQWGEVICQEDYRCPVLDFRRAATVDERGGQIPTWTVALGTNRSTFLEWRDDHWVRLEAVENLLFDMKIVWRGRKVGQ